MLKVRRELAHGDLGAVGADAIRQTLLAQGLAAAPWCGPSTASSGVGALWIAAQAAPARSAQRLVSPRGGRGQGGAGQHPHRRGLVIKDGPQVEVLNVVSLHGGLVGSWPVEAPVTSARTLAALVEHWREVGLPDYAQFDNDMIFQGTHRYADALRRVIRLCLSLAVVPVSYPRGKWASRP